MTRLPSAVRVDVARVASALDVAGAIRETDEVAAEEPLEIRISGDTLAITMRTPGHDHELVAGLLLAEGLITSRDDLGGIAHCGKPHDEGYGNVVDVAPGPGFAFDLDRLRGSERRSVTSAACGVCGRRSIEDLLARVGPVTPARRLDPEVVASLPDRLRSAQPTFDRTGGLHAAAVASADGELLCVREDVGRHNAVDKVVGRLLLDGRTADGSEILVVSGRVSFEIVQKALAARIATVIAVSAPSSLAVRTAERSNLTLIGFVRGGGFNVYTGFERLTGSPH